MPRSPSIQKVALHTSTGSGIVIFSEKQEVIQILAPLTRQIMHENAAKKQNWHEFKNVRMAAILGSVHYFGDMAAK